MSDRDISAGSWSPQLMKALRTSDACIACLTPGCGVDSLRGRSHCAERSLAAQVPSLSPSGSQQPHRLFPRSQGHQARPRRLLPQVGHQSVAGQPLGLRDQALSKSGVVSITLRPHRHHGRSAPLPVSG
jgi:hypothetical protein